MLPTGNKKALSSTDIAIKRAEPQYLLVPMCSCGVKPIGWKLGQHTLER